jgi:hypothetical protein
MVKPTFGGRFFVGRICTFLRRRLGEVESGKGLRAGGKAIEER